MQSAKSHAKLGKPRVCQPLSQIVNDLLSLGAHVQRLSQGKVVYSANPFLKLKEVSREDCEAMEEGLGEEPLSP